VEEVFVDSQPPVVDGAHTRRLQALRREMNEQLRRLNHRDGGAGALHLLCECGRCNEHVVVTAERQQARAIPGRPLVKPGHDNRGNAPSVAEGVSVAGGEAA
jgi:hypothetical protein